MSEFHVLNLAFDPAQNAFDDEPLRRLQETHEIVQLDQHLVGHEGRWRWVSR